MLTIMMRHVSSNSLMIFIITEMTDFIVASAAGPSGIANGSSAHLKTKTKAVTSAGRKTASTTVTLKNFAKSGMPESICMNGRRGVGTLNSALQPSLNK